LGLGHDSESRVKLDVSVVEFASGSQIAQAKELQDGLCEEEVDFGWVAVVEVAVDEHFGAGGAVL